MDRIQRGVPYNEKSDDDKKKHYDVIREMRQMSDKIAYENNLGRIRMRRAVQKMREKRGEAGYLKLYRL